MYRHYKSQSTLLGVKIIFYMPDMLACSPDGIANLLSLIAHGVDFYFVIDSTRPTLNEQLHIGGILGMPNPHLVVSRRTIDLRDWPIGQCMRKMVDDRDIRMASNQNVFVVALNRDILRFVQGANFIGIGDINGPLFAYIRGQMMEKNMSRYPVLAGTQSWR